MDRRGWIGIFDGVYCREADFEGGCRGEVDETVEGDRRHDVNEKAGKGSAEVAK